MRKAGGYPGLLVSGSCVEKIPTAPIPLGERSIRTPSLGTGAGRGSGLGRGSARLRSARLGCGVLEPDADRADIRLEGELPFAARPSCRRRCCPSRRRAASPRPEENRSGPTPWSPSPAPSRRSPSGRRTSMLPTSAVRVDPPGDVGRLDGAHLGRGLDGAPQIRQADIADGLADPDLHLAGDRHFQRDLVLRPFPLVLDSRASSWRSRTLPSEGVHDQLRPGRRSAWPCPSCRPWP